MLRETYNRNTTFIFTLFIIYTLIHVSKEKSQDTNINTSESNKSYTSNIIPSTPEKLYILTKDGSLHLLTKSESNWESKWSANLGGALSSMTYSSRMKVNSDIPIIPIENHLYQNINGKLLEINTSVKELVERAPQSINDYIFVGNKISSLYYINSDSGKIMAQMKYNEYNSNEDCICQKNNMKNKMLTVVRIDYNLNCFQNGEKLWNTTYSEFVIQKEKNNIYSNKISINFEDKNKMANQIISLSDFKQNDILSIHHISNEGLLPIKIYEKDKNINELVSEYKQNFVCENKFASPSSILSYNKNKMKDKVDDINIKSNFNTNNTFSFNDVLYLLETLIIVIYTMFQNYLYQNLFYVLFLLFLLFIISNLILIHFKGNKYKQRYNQIQIYKNYIKEQYNTFINKNIINKETLKLPNENYNNKPSENNSNSNSNSLVSLLDKNIDKRDISEQSLAIKNEMIEIYNIAKNLNPEETITQNQIESEIDNEKVVVEIGYKNILKFKRNEETEELSRRLSKLKNNNSSIKSENSIYTNELEKQINNKKKEKSEELKLKSNNFINSTSNKKTLKSKKSKDNSSSSSSSSKMDDSIIINTDKLSNRKNTDGIVLSNINITGENQNETSFENSISERNNKSGLNMTKNIIKSIEKNKSILKYNNLEKNLLENRNASKTEQYFEEFSDIGQGGFGFVLKAKHKIDEGIYALKFINLKNEKNVQEVISEAKTMMKIKYKHIVEYKTCWYEINIEHLINKYFNLEDSEYVSSNKDSCTPSHNYSSSIKYSKSNKKSFSSKYNKNISSKKSKSNSIIFEEDENEDNNCMQESDLHIIFEDNISDEDIITTKKNKITSKPLISFRDDTEIGLHSKKSKISQDNKLITQNVYFVIQMEYCDGQPLNKFLEDNSTSGISRDTIFRIIYQILKALREIHLRGIIHRDIKPANIFLIGKDKKDIKIGDFGLAIQNNHHTINTHDFAGTPLYLSPEQCSDKNYNEKVDIYACGIILFELCGSFDTFMERRVQISNLRDKRIISDNIKFKYDIESQLIMKMTEKEPNNRPSAIEILNSEIFKKWKKTVYN